MSFFEERCPKMDRYLELNASGESDLLKRLRKETYLKTTHPHMVSGVQQGRFLALISKMLRPQNILEIGTFTGYSSLCLAEGLAIDGRLTTLDVNEDLAYIPQKYFQESEFSEQIDFKLESATDFLKTTTEKFDLVFIDADKENYIHYFELIKPKINSGGFILFDNVLWYGQVLEENPKREATKILKKLNEQIAKDPDFENVIIPLRDGINIVRKK
ncbi:MAG: methyltransferase [Flavobacteriales bacterium]|nr:MAG: methyltransferase [Flavobacteriales bacterium]